MRYTFATSFPKPEKHTDLTINFATFFLSFLQRVKTGVLFFCSGCVKTERTFLHQRIKNFFFWSFLLSSCQHKWAFQDKSPYKIPFQFTLSISSFPPKKETTFFCQLRVFFCFFRILSIIEVAFFSFFPQLFLSLFIFEETYWIVLQCYLLHNITKLFVGNTQSMFVRKFTNHVNGTHMQNK